MRLAVYLKRDNSEAIIDKVELRARIDSKNWAVYAIGTKEQIEKEADDLEIKGIKVDRSVFYTG